jgi:hypothetical protein
MRPPPLVHETWSRHVMTHTLDRFQEDSSSRIPFRSYGIKIPET